MLDVIKKLLIRVLILIRSLYLLLFEGRKHSDDDSVIPDLYYPVIKKEFM